MVLPPDLGRRAPLDLVRHLGLTRERRLAFGLFAGFLALYVAGTLGVLGANPGSRHALVRAVAEEGRLTIDSFKDYAVGRDIARCGDHHCTRGRMARRYTAHMPLIREEVAEQLRREFERLQHPVRLAVFSQALVDPDSEQVRRLVEELGALDARIAVESHNFVLDKERADALGIVRTPGIAILGAEKDYGIRFYGQPSGYEFGALVDAILDVSSGDSGLAPETKAALVELPRPVHIQVFSTPTCPYCPRAMRMAYRFALESDRVSADGIEVTGYPDLAQKYRVSSVPKTVVGENVEFVGAGPEAMLLAHVQQAATTGGLILG